MTTQLRAEAHLEFRVEGPDDSPVTGTLTGSGRRLRLEVDRPDALAGARDAGAIRSFAGALAAQGLVIDVVHAGARLVSLGATRASWWQRRLTGSRHIRVAGLRGALAPGLARLRGGGTSALLPDRGLVPPGTLLPLAPTVSRHARRAATTTHARSGAGSPRLALVPRDFHWPGEQRTVYWLEGERTRIGSDADADIRLDGLAGLHAEVVHDEEDEYVLVSHHPGTRVNGEARDRALLRTGSRVEVGGWPLVFAREEYADHGRPYGGRIGGELGHQRTQPPRPADAGEELSDG